MVELNHAGSDDDDDDNFSVCDPSEDDGEEVIESDDEEPEDPEHNFDRESCKKWMDKKHKVVVRKWNKKKNCSNGKGCIGCRKELKKAKEDYATDLEKAESNTLRTGVFERAGSKAQKMSNAAKKTAVNAKKATSKLKKLVTKKK